MAGKFPPMPQRHFLWSHRNDRPFGEDLTLLNFSIFHVIINKIFFLPITSPLVNIISYYGSISLPSNIPFYSCIDNHFLTYETRVSILRYYISFCVQSARIMIHCCSKKTYSCSSGIYNRILFSMDTSAKLISLSGWNI